MRKSIRARLLISLITIFILVGCKTVKDGEFVKNVEVNVNKPPIRIINYEFMLAKEKDQASKLKNQGDKFLLEKNYKLAKSAYNQAILKDKYNKELYIGIKNSYMLVERYDEAYEMISHAIHNNMDMDEINEILEEIYNKIGIISLNAEAYQQDLYMLPEEIDIIVNGSTVKDKLIWNKKVATDTPGKYMYEGYTEVYSRCVNLTLNVKENVYERKVGYIRNIYVNEKEEVLIDFDEAEFFEGDQALVEAVKDNQVEVSRDGSYVDPCGYYIRNSSYDREIIKINSFPSYELIENEVNHEERESMDLVNVDFHTLRKYVDNYKDCDDEDKLLFYVDIKNNKVISIVRQYLQYN